MGSAAGGAARSATRTGRAAPPEGPGVQHICHPCPATADEEPDLIRLAQLWPRAPLGREAADRVLARHRGLVVRHCERACMAGFELDDLIQEGQCTGLEAIKYFNADRGCKFNTYLMDCVRRRVWKWLNERKPLPQEGVEEELDIEPAEDRTGRQDARDRLDRALAELDPLTAQVVRLANGIEPEKPLSFLMIGRRLRLPTKDVERRHREALEYVKDEAAAGTLAV